MIKIKKQYKILISVILFAQFMLMFKTPIGNSVSIASTEYFEHNYYLNATACKPNFLIEDANVDNNWRIIGGNTTAPNTWTNYNPSPYRYNATYTFTNITQWTKDPNWNNSYNNVGNYSIIDFSAHNRVFYTKMSTNYTDAFQLGAANKSIPKTIGGIFNVSFWYYFDSSASSLFRFTLKDTSTSQVIEFEQYTNHFHYMFDQDISTSFVANVWHYILVSIDYDSSIVRFYLDNSPVVQKAFLNTIKPDIFILSPFSLVSGICNHYIDAIDFSFDSTCYYRRNYYPYSDFRINEQYSLESSNVFNNPRYYNLEQFEYINYPNNAQYLMAKADFYIDYLHLVAFVTIFDNLSISIGGYCYMDNPDNKSDFISIQYPISNWNKAEINIHAYRNQTSVYNFRGEIRFDKKPSLEYEFEWSYRKGGTYLGAYSIDSMILPYNNSNYFRNFVLAYRTLFNIVTKEGFIYSYNNVGYISEELYFPPVIPVIDNTPIGNNDSYWEYISFEIWVTSTDEIVIGNNMINWTIYINITDTRPITQFYPYSSIGESCNQIVGNWGNWGIFDFLRVTIGYILGFLWFLLEVIGYVITWLFAYVIWYLLLQLFTIVIWDILVYWLYIGVNWIAFGLLLVLVNLPQILAWTIALIVAGLIYALSFGTLDFNTIFTNVTNVVLEIVNAIIDFGALFFSHIDVILLFTVGYVTLIGFMYVKIFYCKGRGYNNRAKKLQDSAGSFLKPIKWVLSVIGKIKEAVMPTTAGDESDNK